MKRSNHLTSLRTASPSRRLANLQFHLTLRNTNNKARPRSTIEAPVTRKITQNRSTRVVWKQHEVNFWDSISGYKHKSSTATIRHHLCRKTVIELGQKPFPSELSTDIVAHQCHHRPSDHLQASHQSYRNLWYGLCEEKELEKKIITCRYMIILIIIGFSFYLMSLILFTFLKF